MRRIDRFDEYMTVKHLNDNKVTMDLGLSIGTIGKSRKEGRDLSDKVVEQILNFYTDLSRAYLLAGEGEMLKKESGQPVPVKGYSAGVPYYNVDVLGGFDLVLNDQTVLPEYLIDFKEYNKATCWCNITGHSMEPEITSGDIIALKEILDPSFLPFGEIYAIITTNGMRTVKRIGPASSPDCYSLIPTNKAPEYGIQEIPRTMILKVYEVLGCMKKL